MGAKTKARPKLRPPAKKPAAGVLCGAPKGKGGELCTQPAGKGTDHVGTGRCRWHESKGGLMSTAHKVGVEAVSPSQAITGVLNLTSSQLAYVSAQVAALEEDELWTGAEGQRLNKWVRWQERLMDRVAKYASTAVGMGVAEKHGKLAEAQTRLVTRLLGAVLDELDLTPSQRKKVGPAIRKNAAMVLEGNATEVK